MMSTLEENTHIIGPSLLEQAATAPGLPFLVETLSPYARGISPRSVPFARLPSAMNAHCGALLEAILPTPLQETEEQITKLMDLFLGGCCARGAKTPKGASSIKITHAHHKL